MSSQASTAIGPPEVRDTTDAFLTSTELMPEHLPLDSMTPEEEEVVRNIFILLVPCCRGRALWMQLQSESEPTLVGRHTSMLVGFAGDFLAAVQE